MDSFIKSQIEENKQGWIKSFEHSFAQDASGNPLPWMTYGIINYLEQWLDKDKVIFEYGFGASSFFFAKRVKKVVSLETDPMWYKVMKNKLKEHNITNIDVIFMENGLENAKYEHFANNYGQKFDLIIIDSLKRANCCYDSISALKDDGMIILDDSQRKSYKKIFRFFDEKNFLTKNFIGIAPGQFRLKNSTVFYKS